MFVVVSYRQEYTDRYNERSNSSNLEILNCQTEKSVVDYISRRIHDDVEADFVNLIFDSWDRFSDYGVGATDSPSSGSGSIHVANYFDLDQNWSEEEQLRLNNLEQVIRDAVTQKLEEQKLADKIKANQEQADELEKQNKLKTEYERVIYERLKVKFENPNS